MKNKIYLRVIKRFASPHTAEESFELFEGDLKQDRDYHKKYHNSEARYFELKEVK